MYEDVYIQVYRKREAPLKGHDYLGPVDLEELVDPEYLLECSGEDLEALIPFEELQLSFGGGMYQCRFTIQRPGERTTPRSRNITIPGRRKPTWQDEERAETELERRCPTCGSVLDN